MSQRMRNERLTEVGKMMLAEYTEGRQDGLAEGYAVAQRIAVWYATNHTLAEPKSPETLREWSRVALDELKSKLTK